MGALSVLFGKFCLEIVFTFVIIGSILFRLINETIISKSFLLKVTKYDITELNLQIKADFTTIH